MLMGLVMNEKKKTYARQRKKSLQQSNESIAMSLIFYDKE